MEKKYIVTIRRIFEHTFEEIEAKDEDEALELAEEKFDCLDHIYGDEMYSYDYEVKEEN